MLFCDKCQGYLLENVDLGVFVCDNCGLCGEQQFVCSLWEAGYQIERKKRYRRWSYMMKKIVKLNIKLSQSELTVMKNMFYNINYLFSRYMPRVKFVSYDILLATLLDYVGHSSNRVKKLKTKMNIRTYQLFFKTAFAIVPDYLIQQFEAEH